MGELLRRGPRTGTAQGRLRRPHLHPFTPPCPPRRAGGLSPGTHSIGIRSRLAFPVVTDFSATGHRTDSLKLMIPGFPATDNVTRRCLGDNELACRRFPACASTVFRSLRLMDGRSDAGRSNQTGPVRAGSRGSWNRAPLLRGCGVTLGPSRVRLARRKGCRSVQLGTCLSACFPCAHAARSNRKWLRRGPGQSPI